MKTIATILILLLNLTFGYSQNTINGILTEKDGTPVIGANVFLDGTYDGTTSDVDGAFSFETNETGEQKIVITYLGYETINLKKVVNELQNLNIIMRESAQALDAVVITASTFKAGDNSKLAVLKPLDVVTTAGSMGDVIAAMQNLPGTQANPEDGRLFVRGGDARETQIHIDGLRVFSPYLKTISGTPTRGRYSPFLFKGMSFSTGGYAAEFGQALSGVLDMNTIDQPDATETNLSLMSVGVGIGHTQKWDKQSISLSANYIDLSPYYQLIKTKLDLLEPVKSFSGEAVYRYKTKKGLLKSYVAGDYQRVKVNYYNLDERVDQGIAINNYNYYSNTSYNTILNDKTSLYTGVSFGVNENKTRINDEFDLNTDLSGVHTKASLTTAFNDHFVMNYGSELIFQNDGLSKSIVNGDSEYSDNVKRTITGNFIEADYFFSKKLAIKLGMRGEYHSLTKQYELLPRLTLAQKLGKNGQLSAAVGYYSQEVSQDYLFYNKTLGQENASHFLVNYNFKNDKQILRLEAYYKNYNRLVKYDSENNFNTDGNGYAYGFDVFWRANDIIKNTDFWISYSWLQSERNYWDYPTAAMPPYITNHNLSVVGKRWLPKLKSQFNITYQLASGRPYENPNTVGFLNERSKNFNNLSMSWAYLISSQKILFVSVSNFPGFQNEFGSRYASTPDQNGIYPSVLIEPNEKRFLFAGFFMTISKDKTKNQLDNL